MSKPTAHYGKLFTKGGYGSEVNVSAYLNPFLILGSHDSNSVDVEVKKSPTPAISNIKVISNVVHIDGEEQPGLPLTYRK